MVKFYALTTFLLFSVIVWSSSLPQQTGGSSSSVGATPPIIKSPTLGGSIPVPDGTLCPICGTGTVTGGVCDNPDCPSNVPGDPVGGEMPLSDNVLLLLIPLSIYTIIKLKKRNILSV
ncbi:MAG: hypothetical protein P4L28_02685 [Paludibacteraceae bacterium]|nr:hypothetical protein [Paludibacteraceae bacterium]